MHLLSSLFNLFNRKQNNYKVSFDCFLCDRHPLGKILFDKHHRERICSLDKAYKEFELKEVKKLI